jgi:hypothetical protein
MNFLIISCQTGRVCASRAAGPASPRRRQPLLDAGHLAGPRRGHAADGAGEPAVSAALQFDGDQFVHAEGLGDRPRHELIGGGDDHHLVAAPLVATQQVQRLRQQLRADHLAHETLMRRRRLVGAALAQGIRGEAHVVVDVERAGLVVLVELVVAALELHRIGPADLLREDSPGVIGIDRQQRVVEIEQGQGCPGALASLRSHSFSSIDLISGMVIARLVCSA